ncbi:MAG TPA: TIGR01777 family oxidoreductase, partial [Candidatus Limnocylindrales bacterium]
MKVVIAGGTGMMGRTLTTSLLTDGHEVVILTRRVPPAAHDGVSYERWSGSRGGADRLAAVLAGADSVVNLTGIPVGPLPWTPGRRRGIRASRVEPTKAIIEGLERVEAAQRPGVLVSISGSDAYTGQDAVPATEATPSAGGFLADVLQEWEAAALAAEALGVRVVILRTGFVIGRGTELMRLFALPFRLGLGGRLGDGRQWMSWIHRDDVIGLMRTAIADPRYRGVINGVSPTPVREADLAKAIGRTLHRPSWLPVPA